MQELEKKGDIEKLPSNEDHRYERPAIIYEGQISTRAGSNFSDPKTDDPTGIDLFNN